MPAQGRPSVESCPECGAQLSRWPSLEGDGYIQSCDSCGYTAAIEQEASDPPSPDDQPPARFRDLLAAHEKFAPSELPDELLQELPASAREALSPDAEPPPDEPNSLSDDLEQRLKQHGYILSTDGHGPRISGGHHRPGTGDLSAYDLVRLAAEMEGGVPSPDQKTQCPHCQAVIPVGEERCPWCDNGLDWDQDLH